jgi:type II secretory pathway component PulM
MKAWWNNLAFREKQTIAIGAVLVGIFLIYALIFAPLNNAVLTLRQQIEKKQQLLAWMKSADEKIQLLEKSQQKTERHTTSASLLSAVQMAVTKNEIAKNVLQLQEVENNSIQLKLQQVNFDAVIQWLIVLCQQQQLMISQMNIKPATTPGIVDIELEFTLGA